MTEDEEIDDLLSAKREWDGVDQALASLKASGYLYASNITAKTKAQVIVAARNGEAVDTAIARLRPDLINTGHSAPTPSSKSGCLGLIIFSLIFGGCLSLVGCGIYETHTQPARTAAAIERGLADGRVRQRFAEDIKAKQVALGMNMVEVILSWGKPQRTNSSVSAAGRSEQWVYRRGKYRSQYVHFRRGVVTYISSW